MVENPNLGFIYHGLAYLSMFLISWWAYTTKSLKFISERGWPQKKEILFFLMTWGILVWAFIPIIISGKAKAIALIFGQNQPGSIQLVVVLGLSILAFVIGLSQAYKLDIKSPVFQPHPTYLLNSSYLIFRVLFLISYEIWFRGYFLKDLLMILSVPASIGINISLYSLIHIFAGRKEALSSLAFGVILCSMVISLDAVWPAVVIHLSLSMGYEAGFIGRLSRN